MVATVRAVGSVQRTASLPASVPGPTSRFLWRAGRGQGLTAVTRGAPSAPTTTNDPLPVPGPAAQPPVPSSADRSELAAWRLPVARVATVAVAAAGVYYLTWRLTTVDGTGALGIAFYAVEAMSFGMLVLTAALFWRLRRRSGAPAPPSGSLDVFITVCGEPVELVEASLQAALAIDYPHRTYLLNDGRLAGKSGWEAIDELAARHGIPCFTRTTGARGKAGNLNHAVPLTGGDFVAVLDCDHRASARLAHDVLGYFADSGVAFVTTRQEFHADRSDVLGTREPLFFSWSQPAKDVAGAATSTGSGVVYRRSALDSVGGFSEWSIIEDFHTSMSLHAAGWSSVYHPMSVTVGAAPLTSAVLARQRLTWATDHARVCFYDNPLFRRGLTLGKRLHYLHAASYYPVASGQLFFLVSPALWLLWQVPVMRPSSTESYLAHSLPLAAATLALICTWGGRLGIRAIEQQLYLAPVYALGVARAASGIRFRSGVTQKLRQSGISLLTLPQLVIAGLLVAAIADAFLHPAEGQAVAVAWAAFMAYSLTTFVTTVSGRPRIDRALRVAVRTAVVLVAALVILPVGEELRQGSSATGATSTRQGPPLALVPPEHGAYLGVFNPYILQRPDGLTVWNEEHGSAARIVHWYQPWYGDGPLEFPSSEAAMVADQGAVPLITWEPLGEASAEAVGGSAGNPLEVIVSGAEDAYIRSWARAAAAYGRPVLIRPLRDMNGSWYPWSIEASGSSPGLFVAAWRHLHDLFVEEGAVNVGWVWSVYSFERAPGRQLRRFYPGADYVDWVAMAAFNWGDTSGGSWQGVDALFGSTYDALSRLRKPVMISQVATVEDGGNAEAWVHHTLGRLRHDYPLVKALVWFDARLLTDVDLRLRGDAARAFAAEMGASDHWAPPLLTVAAPEGDTGGTVG